MTKESLIEGLEAGIRTNELEGHIYTDEEKAVVEKIKSGKMTLEQARKHFIEGLKAGC